ncbi:DUF177 domain-containing protein [Synechococcales cyanobacterium C]|uniref:DUF177 domain-containing protein n=1 Tax=Petrachloros mirabilis ULC683 TaxID=2781853 RepID=A0A8K1ZY11_9CYAN|nr:YceD family protein [Petrachloros mirabilis]NCJ06193.1 DUF177 domain-containing protein [Petrachloros mirabilis ULC683]
MEPIYLPQLAKAWQKTETQTIQTYLPTLATLTPVQGVLKAVHQGNYLQVSTELETIVTLSCDRCLQQYNQRLSIQPTELIWLTEAEDLLPEPNTCEDSDLLEALPSHGYFDPEDWVYQQLCLALPQQQICMETCTGIAPQYATDPSSSLDRRWAALADLRHQLES